MRAGTLLHCGEACGECNYVIPCATHTPCVKISNNSSVFLVVDGGWYYSSMEEFVFPYHAFVPLSVFGEYFLVEEEVKGRVPAPLPRSYCQDPVSPRKVERRPMNEGDVSIANSLLITLDTKGHYLERSQDFLAVSDSSLLPKSKVKCSLSFYSLPPARRFSFFFLFFW